MVERVHIRQSPLAISSTASIMPVKSQNGNLQDKRFKKRFQEEKEKNKKKDKAYVMQPSETVVSDDRRQGIFEPPNIVGQKTHTINKPDDGLRRQIDILV